MKKRSMEPDDDLKRLFDDPHSAQRPAGACPSADELARAQEGSLSAAERERLADHLVLCRDCAEAYRLLGGLQPLAARAAEAMRGEAPRPAGRRGWGAAQRLLAAACVALAVVALSLAGWVFRLRGQQRGVEGVWLNVPIVDLEETAVRSSGGPAAPRVSRRSGAAALLLHPVGSPGTTTFSLALLDPKGKRRWQAEGLRAGPEGALTLVLPTRDLVPGSYRLRLYGGRGAERAQVAEFSMDVVE